MPLALIQLISEQTMQNLVPILALKPARVVHLATAKTAPRSGHIIEAARQAGIATEVENIRLSPMPSIAETSRAILRSLAAARAAKLTPVVNFTGGTKLMSIGAYEAALWEKALSFYMDTQDEMFMDGGTATGLAARLREDFSFSAVQRLLTVNTVAVANGRERVTAGRDWRPFLPLAKHLFSRPAEEQATHEALFGSAGMFPRGLTPQTVEHWLPVLDKKFQLPPNVAKLASAVGLLRETGGGHCQLPDGSHAELRALVEARVRKSFVADYDRRRIAATDRLQQTVSFLTGGWWEVVVAEAVEKSGLFRDLRWSANAGQRGGADLEEDLLALDGVQIVCISCKRGGARARLLPQLEELNARARSLGGHFTRRFLAVFHPLTGAVGRNVIQRARELDVRLLTPDNLSRPETFARTQSRG